MAGGVRYIPEEFGKPKEYCHPHHRIPTDLEPAFVIGKDESCCPQTSDPCECVTSGDIEKWNFVYDNFSALENIDVSAINDFVDDVSALNSSADDWNSTFETVSSNSANWNTVDDLKASAEDHEEHISDLEDFVDDTEDRLSAIDNKLENLHFDNDITDPDHSISGDGSISAPFGVNNYATLKTTNDNYEELNRHIVKFSADGVKNTLYEFDGAAYNVARIDSRLSGIDQTNDTQNTNIQRNYELITEVANRQKGKQDKLAFGYNNSGYVVSINNSALVGEMGGLTGDLQGALDEVYENSANWSEVSAKVDATAFDETVNSINDSISIETSARIDADSNLSATIDTKLDTSAFENVSGSFYTTANPSGFITNTVNDLVNYYTTASSYNKAEINEMLANFGGFEVVQLDASGKPDVANPSTKIIYLTKEDDTQITDPYTEWIFTSADAQTTAWEIIGETSVDLTNYYTKNETSGAQELSTEFGKYVQTANTGSWDVTDYSGKDGVYVSKHEIGLSANYKTAVESVSGKLDASIYETNSGTFYTKDNPSGFITGVDLTPYQPVSAMTGYYTKSETSGSQEISDALTAKQDTLSFEYNGSTITAINTSAVGQVLQAGTDLKIAEGIISVNTNGTANSANMAFVEGAGTSANGFASHAEGCITTAAGSYSHAEGYVTSAGHDFSHAEGNMTTAGAAGAHVEGQQTLASGLNGHAEGWFSVAGGNHSHAEGYSAVASGPYSHAEGDRTLASSWGSHAGGISSVAVGSASFVHGILASADGEAAVALGLGENGAITGEYEDPETEEWVPITADAKSVASGKGAIAFGYGNSAIGNYAIAGGQVSIASGINAIAIGGEEYEDYDGIIHWGNSALNDAAVALGDNTLAEGYASFAEGMYTVAKGDRSHAEGSRTSAIGNNSHAEGGSTSAVGNCSHAEGNGAKAIKDNSHAEGEYTLASGLASHTEGSRTFTSGTASHAEGCSTSAYGYYSHSEGSGTNASGNYSHAEGYNNVALGAASHAEGNTTTAGGNLSHAEGQNTYADVRAHAEGLNTTASGWQAHSEGDHSIAAGGNAHAEGSGTSALGNGSHTEGEYTLTSGEAAHAEGYATTASGDASHAEGYYTSALNDADHAEGWYTIASGYYSHAEGDNTVAGGLDSHAEGSYASAMGANSHAGGEYTIASGTNTTVIGKYNSANSAAFIVGNGTNNAKSDAFVVDWDGKASATKLATSGIPDIEQAISAVLPTIIYTSATGELHIDFSNGGN